MLNNYLEEAPESAFIYNTPWYQRMHVSCTHQYPNGNSNNDCPSTGWNSGERFEREITENDEFYFDREAAWGPTASVMTHFKFTADQLSFDVRLRTKTPLTLGLK